MRPVDDLDLAREAASAAGAVIRRWFRRVERADFKGRVDPVTAADREAEAAITGLLERERPDDGILGEEGSDSRSGSGRRWVVDPLDGTVNFLHGIPHVAVSIGLEDGDGPLVGVVLDVFRDEEFTAVRGGGARLDGEPIRVSGRDEMHTGMFTTGFAYDRQEHGPAYAAVLGRVLTRARGVRRLGTAAIDLAWVACGRTDGHWEFSLKPWDVVAGMLLVSEAGGTLSDSYGGPARPEDILATNGHLHEELRALVAAHRPPHLGGPG